MSSGATAAPIAPRVWGTGALRLTDTHHHDRRVKFHFVGLARHRDRSLASARNTIRLVVSAVDWRLHDRRGNFRPTRRAIADPLQQLLIAFDGVGAQSFVQLSLCTLAMGVGAPR